MANKENSIGYKFKGDASGFQKVIGDMQKSLSSLKKWTQTIGLNAAFDIAGKVIRSTRAIVDFTKESAKLSAEAEGITNAFDKLNEPSLLSNLRIATRGTVDDVVLMQKAVQANNFKIPLDQLATFFEFATKRAIETGESVDFLVNSLITGLGRKSVLVMDNLGISAVQLQAEVERVGDFGTAAGNIIRKELSSMGDVADTTAVKMQQTSVAVKDLKLAWGEYVNQSKAAQGVVQWITDELTIFADKDLNIWEKLNGSPNEYKEWKKRTEEAKQAFSFLNGIPSGGGSVTPWRNNVSKEQVKTIASIEEETKQLQEELRNLDIEDKKGIETINKKIEANKKLVESLTNIIDTEEEREKQLKKLKDETKDLNRDEHIGFFSMTTPEKDKVRGGGMARGGGDLAGGPAGIPEYAKEVADSLTIAQSAVMNLENTFTQMFINVGGGFKGMVQAIMDSIKMLLAQLAAKAFMFAILQMIFPASGAATGALSGLKKFIGVPGFAGGTNFAPGGLAVVGERGPELVNLPRGSQVIPHGGMAPREELITRINGTGLDIILKRTYKSYQTNT